MLCKDASTAQNSNKYRVLVHSQDGMGATFFGKAANMHSDAAAAKKFEKQAASMCKFNTYVDAVVEKKGNMWCIKESKLRV